MTVPLIIQMTNNIRLQYYLQDIKCLNSVKNWIYRYQSKNTVLQSALYALQQQIESF